jgi:hypothetical protein
MTMTRSRRVEIKTADALSQAISRAAKFLQSTAASQTRITVCRLAGGSACQIRGSTARRKILRYLVALLVLCVSMDPRMAVASRNIIGTKKEFVCSPIQNRHVCVSCDM